MVRHWFEECGISGVCGDVGGPLGDSYETIDGDRLSDEFDDRDDTGDGRLGSIDSMKLRINDNFSG